jgi:hypothetical protein
LQWQCEVPIPVEHGRSRFIFPLQSDRKLFVKLNHFDNHDVKFGTWLFLWKMKKFFTTILIGAIAWMPATAIATPANHRCDSDSAVIRQSDPFISVCKMPIKTEDSEVITGSFKAYSLAPNFSLKAIIRLTDFVDGDRLITLVEVGSYQLIQFWIRDHKFNRWAGSPASDPSIVNQYRPEIKLLLDTAENSKKNFDQF